MKDVVSQTIKKTSQKLAKDTSSEENNPGAETALLARVIGTLIA